LWDQRQNGDPEVVGGRRGRNQMATQEDREAGAEPGKAGTDVNLTHDLNLKRGPPLKPDIAQADKIARTGSTEESIRNTPPAGEWNDSSSD
jgi:hypothetical protein